MGNDCDEIVIDTTKATNKISIVVGILLSLLSIFMIISLSGCSMLDSKLNDLRGDITGNTYTIDTFSNFGEKVMTTHGQKISIDSNIVEEKSYSSDGWITTETLSSVITITVDGHQIISCGDTCIFYEDGLKPEYNFYIDRIDSSSDSFTDNALIAGMVNEVKNMFGKSMVVVIKSQTGAPIYAFSGDNVYWEVPDNLPKFTKLFIDGKALYIHRANFQIIDKELLG